MPGRTPTFVDVRFFVVLSASETFWRIRRAKHPDNKTTHQSARNGQNEKSKPNICIYRNKLLTSQYHINIHTTMNEEKILNLPLRKVHALEILRGEKVREYRTGDHWAKRICLFEDPKHPFVATSLKDFDKVHFYPYNKKWFLDCKIKAIIFSKVDDEFLELFGNEVEAKKGEWWFIIRLDGVIDTNLKAE